MEINSAGDADRIQLPRSARTTKAAKTNRGVNGTSSHEESKQKAVDDPAQMVADIEQFIRRFVVLPEAAYLPMAIWIIGTYAAQCFECYPYIALLSPASRRDPVAIANGLALRRCVWEKGGGKVPLTLVVPFKMNMIDVLV
jgi:hypothetical protein